MYRPCFLLFAICQGVSAWRAGPRAGRPRAVGGVLADFFILRLSLGAVKKFAPGEWPGVFARAWRMGVGPAIARRWAVDAAR